MNQQLMFINHSPVWLGDPALGVISLADFVALTESLSRLESEDSSEEEDAQ